MNNGDGTNAFISIINDGDDTIDITNNDYSVTIIPIIVNDANNTIAVIDNIASIIGIPDNDNKLSIMGKNNSIIVIVNIIKLLSVFLIVFPSLQGNGSNTPGSVLHTIAITPPLTPLVLIRAVKAPELLPLHTMVIITRNSSISNTYLHDQ